MQLCKGVVDIKDLRGIINEKKCIVIGYCFIRILSNRCVDGKCDDNVGFGYV